MGMGSKAYANANKALFKQNLQMNIENMFKSTFCGVETEVSKDILSTIKTESGKMADQIVDFIVNTVTNVQLTGPGPVVSTIITPGFGAPATGALPFTGVELNAN